jgi:hypothetical protein
MAAVQWTNAGIESCAPPRAGHSGPHRAGHRWVRAGAGGPCIHAVRLERCSVPVGGRGIPPDRRHDRPSQTHLHDHHDGRPARHAAPHHRGLTGRARAAARAERGPARPGPPPLLAPTEGRRRHHRAQLEPPGLPGRPLHRGAHAPHGHARPRPFEHRDGACQPVLPLWRPDVSVGTVPAPALGVTPHRGRQLVPRLLRLRLHPRPRRPGVRRGEQPLRPGAGMP